MNKEKILEIIIQAIFSWSGIVLVIAIICIGVFRKEISAFLKGVKQIKTKGLEVNTEQGKKENEESSKKEELAKEEEQGEEKAPEPQKVEEPKNLEDWRMEMIFATFDKNQTRADEAFKKMQELNSDPLSRKKDAILYLKFSHTAGKTDAIPRIRVFLTDMEVVYDANMALGFCYANSDDFENATKFYSQALEKASNEKEKSVVASQYSSSLYRN